MSFATPVVVDLAGLADAAGSASFERGLRYARQGRVLRARWDAKDDVLHGSVAGRGEVYSTSVYFGRDDRDWDALVFDAGECSCPIGYDCKHVVALAVHATSGAQPAAAPKKAPKAPTWEQSLDTLLAPAQFGPTGRTDSAPLAIELTLADGSGRGVSLRARLVTPGRNGWVAGGLSWSKLVSGHSFADHVPDQVQLLREMYALYRSGHADSGRYAHGYYGDDKSIDMSSFESHQLWPLLDQAKEVGLKLVHGRKRLGPVAAYGSAEFCLDVTRDDSSGAVRVSPLLRVADGELDAAPISFIGSPGHGVVYIDRAEVRDLADHSNWHIRLAKLVKPIPPALCRMAQHNEHLIIPATGHDRFRDRYYARLRRAATFVSSDASFTPPVISAPTLVVHADYGTDHRLRTSWEWAYQVGDAARRVSPDTVLPDDDYRDLDAEHAILTGLDLPEPLPQHAEFQGIDTVRFATEVLPLLADRPGVDIETSGAPADYREVSDTLTIGVSTGEVPSESDWFELGVTITVDGREVAFGEVFTALAQGQSHLLLPDGAYFSLDKPELRRLRELIEESRALHDAPGDSLRISRFQAGLWDELATLGVVHHQAKAWQEQVAGLLSIESIDPAPVPDTLRAQLRPYQTDGFRWLAFLWQHRLGGILADDMGLGKTVQSLALFCHARTADPGGPPFLIVAPSSVVSNWGTEAARFAPGLTTVTLSDTVRRRGEPLADTVAGADVVVTSYTLFRLDFDDYADLPWSGLVLDEAQQVKNHQSKIHQCARRLPAAFKLAITGTPMENNLMELWSLLSITAPGLFPQPTRFREYFAQPIEKQGDAELLGRLRRRIKPLVKRRTKEQVAADLPAKQEQVLQVELQPRHRKIYQTHLQRERQKVLGLIDDMNKNRFTILKSLTLLRQLSLHAGLVDDAHQDLPSSKIEALVEQLREVTDGGHRALVFSQFTSFLKHVRNRLDADEVEYCYLDGTTRNRGAVLERFKNGTAPVFLVSLKAGGFGLNLTEADYCFLLDPWWNPATEAQAVDRTHRIGQTRNVMVYRLIAKDTIEERVMALQARKAALFASVMDDGNVFGSALDADEIRELFA